MKILYGQTEIEQIIDIINKAFAPVREEDFDFRKIMPKAYYVGSDAYEYHYSVVQDGETVAVAGNMPMSISTHGKTYRYSFLGSVATLPEKWGKGYMRLLMNRIEKDDITDGKVFSVLTGARKRYSRYGYQKIFSSFEYVFDEYYFNHSVKDILVVKDATDYLDDIFAIYSECAPLILREKNSFIDVLRSGFSTVKALLSFGKVVGYYSFCRRKGSVVNELRLIDASYLPSALNSIKTAENLTKVVVKVNPLDAFMKNALDKIAESVSLKDELQIKVYDYRRFLELAVSESQKSYPVPNACEKVSIDDVVYKVIVTDGDVKVEICDEKPDIELSEENCLRRLINGSGYDLKGSRIFPVCFGFDVVDEF